MVFITDRFDSIPFHLPIIAGGGAESRAACQSKDAFERIKKTGLFWVALDIKMTKDGIPVILNHEDIAHAVDAKGMIAETDWQDLATYKPHSQTDEDSSARVLMLGEAIQAIQKNDLCPLLWLRPSKGRSRVTTMVSLIEVAKTWPQEGIFPLVASTDHDSLVIAAQLLPQWPRILMLDVWEEDWLETMLRTSSSAVAMPEKELTNDIIACFQAHDMPVLSYDVTNPKKAESLIKSGVTAVLTNNVREVLAQIA